MYDAALELVHVLPFGREAFRMTVVALAHPQKIRREDCGLAAVGFHRLDGPEVALA
jgi:hypothetical protein